MSNEKSNAAMNEETAMIDLHDLFNTDLVSTIKMEVDGDEDSCEVEVTYEWDFDGTDDNGIDSYFPAVIGVKVVDGSDLLPTVSGQQVEDYLTELAKIEKNDDV